MIHHERLRPPPHDYPADEWNVIEKRFHPEFLAQSETMAALGNGYLGMRGGPEVGGPNAENSTLINGFYEISSIVYPEDAYGFAKIGQTIFGVTDSKIIKLFVDDEPFWLPNANLLSYDRRLNMKSGTLDREILWETPAGKQILITSRRLVSFVNRHVAAISYRVTLLNAAASLVISSEMAAHEPGAHTDPNDPRQTRFFAGRVLHCRASYAKDRRIVLCHATEKSRLTLTCSTDHSLETSCPHTHKVAYTEDLARSPSHSTPSPAVRSISPNTWFITRRRRRRPKNSAAAPSGLWTGLRSMGSSSCSHLKSSTWTISGAAAMSGSKMSERTAQSAAPWRSSKRSASIFFISCR